MKCSECKHPMHEQFKRYPGHWYCFHSGEKCGSKICDTPAEDYDNFPAHNRLLAEAKTPKWCPLKETQS